MRWIWEYLNAFNLENNTELELAHGDVTPRAHSFLEVPLHAISFSVILLVERYVLVNTEIDPGIACARTLTATFGSVERAWTLAISS